MNTPDRSKIKGVLFDLGSTLIENENIPWEEMSRIALGFGYQYLKNVKNLATPYDKFAEEYFRIRQINREHSAKTLQEWIITDAIGDLFDSIGFKTDTDTVTRFFETFNKVFADQLTIYDDTQNVLEKLKRAGLKIGLVSNTVFPDYYHKLDLKKFGIYDYFDFMLYSSSFGYRKPHPLIYKKAIELSGLNPEEMIFVGDRYPEDYLGPRESGIFSILKFYEGRQYPQPFPDEIVMINSLNELLPFCVK